MQISCDCGAFKADLLAFPKNTPGRLACYCKDCQAFLEKIDRTDLFDNYKGTEIIPAYPNDISIVQGLTELNCYRLTDKGIYRWTASCCNSPIVNMRRGFPWAGIYHSAYTKHNPEALHVLGDIKSRIYGRDAVAGAPFKISEKISFTDMLVVIPFIIKGKILRKNQHSPFFNSETEKPISEPVILNQV